MCVYKNRQAFRQTEEKDNEGEEPTNGQIHGERRTTTNLRTDKLTEMERRKDKLTDTLRDEQTS